MSTETLRPNAAGDETSISDQLPSEGEHWDKVDEEVADGDSSCLLSFAGSYQRDLYNLPASSGSGTINFIKVYINCRRHAFSSSGYAKPSLKSNSTVTDGTEVALTTNWTTYSQQWNTNPADSQAWEWADIAALQIGVALKSEGGSWAAYCTQVYVEVDYTSGAVTEKTSSDSGSGADAKASGNPLATYSRSETGSGAEAVPGRDIVLPETGSGVDALYSLETGEAKSSSDSGSGVEGTPMQSAVLAGSETGSGIEALIARLLAVFDTGYGVEAGDVEVEDLFKDLFASELGQGSDSLTAKIETPIKGGGMKLWN